MPQPLEFKTVCLSPTMQSFGVVMDYLSRHAPFCDFTVKNLSSALRTQLQSKCNRAAILNNEVIGYVGWLTVEDDIAKAWLKEGATLIHMPNPQRPAVALSVVVSDQRKVTQQLIHSARHATKGARVYFKRDYTDASRMTRKNTVRNMMSS